VPCSRGPNDEQTAEESRRTLTLFVSSKSIPYHLLGAFPSSSQLPLALPLDMGVVSSCCESCFHSRKSQSYEPLLLENEREAVADLLQYLESAHYPQQTFQCLRTLLIYHKHRPNDNQLLLGIASFRVDHTFVF